MWNKASQRDKERMIRVLSELRNAQTREYRAAGIELEKDVMAAHQSFTQLLQDTHRKYANTLHADHTHASRIEAMVNTILNNGANLDQKLSTKERRDLVNEDRKTLDQLLEKVEESRRKARRQLSCKHEWVVVKYETEEDGHEHVTKAACKNCMLELPIPSEDHIKLEQEFNARDEDGAVSGS